MDNDFTSISNLPLFPGGNGDGFNTDTETNWYQLNLQAVTLDDGSQVYLLKDKVPNVEGAIKVDVDDLPPANFTRWLTEKKDTLISYEDAKDYLLDNFAQYIYEQLTVRNNLKKEIDFRADELMCLIQASVLNIGFNILFGKNIEYKFFEDSEKMFGVTSSSKEGITKVKILEKYFITSKFDKLVLLLNEFTEYLVELIEINGGFDDDSGFAEA